MTIKKLWETFGGTINSKGYKVLDPHIKVVYGDSITPQRCKAIYEILESDGFACNNVILGVGSFSMQCAEEPSIPTPDRLIKQFQPFTRDTFGIAIKATYCEVNGKSIPIYKDPKESGFKKSQKGCCVVRDSGIRLYCEDGLTLAEADGITDNKLVEVFKNGVMTKEQTLQEIRQNLHEGGF
jgi:nicotinamide phosphoribosyltransferase